MKQTSWINDNIKSVLALITVIGGFSYFYMCSIRNIKADPQILIAFVSTISLVTGYFYGSSSSAAKKETDATTPTVTTNSDTTNVNVNPANPNETQTS